jgi:hypothetical protein
MGVQTFVPEPPVEAFDEGVIGRLARPGEVQDHAILVGPTIERLGDALRTIVDTDGPRRAADRGSPGHRLDDLLPSNALININGQGLAGIGIDDRQRPQTPTIE